MTKEQFTGLLRSPSTINLNLIGQLEDVTTRFPYFQNAHLLLAKQYHGHENIRFESYLKKAAAYAQDRTILYKLIKNDSVEVIHINPEKDSIQVETMTNSTDTTGPANASLKISDDELINSTQEETVTQVSVNYVPKIEISENTLKPHSTEIEETIDLPIQDPRIVLEKRLRELEEQDTVTPELPKKKESEIKVISPARNIDRPAIDVSSRELKEERIKKATSVSPVNSQPVSGKEKTASPGVPVSKPVEPVNEMHSFSEWLKMKSVSVIQPGQTGTYFETFNNLPSVESEIKSRPADDLLENFIKTEPRIVPSRSEFYSPGNMARKSALEHDDLISETLARIYAQQGNIPKAIDAYQRLSLKNPEKSSYFAALIRDLEEKNQE